MKAYMLNQYFQVFGSTNVPRVIVYPNNAIAAQLFNHLRNGTNAVKAADCLSGEKAYLPMPHVLMDAIDDKIKAVGKRAVVVGLDAYLALLDEEGIVVFMSELRNRLNAKSPNADYLLSVNNELNFEPRYENCRSVVFIEGSEEVFELLDIQVYPDKWVKNGDARSYQQLLEKMGQYMPCGNYSLILTELTEKQAGVGNAITFNLRPRDVATRYYGMDVDLGDVILEELLVKSAESGESAGRYLETMFGVSNMDIRLALKRLLELSAGNLWAAYVWMLRPKLPGDSYIAKVLSEDVTRDNLLRKYVVDSAITLLADINAKQYAAERAEALKTLSWNYESLVVEFIGQTGELREALPFLNCGTDAERVEIVRRAATEDLSYGLPKEYGELFPTLADYFSDDCDFGDAATATYFKDYRRHKVAGSITDDFVERAFNFVVPKIFPSRDAVIAELRAQEDVGLLVVDAMGVEYLPLLLALAKRRGMNIESQAIVTAKLPTETECNHIQWEKTRLLAEIRGVDNIVHNGAEKHEKTTPEQNFAKTLHVFEKDIMNRIADGLTRFTRVVVTADHGASRLAVIAHNQGKGKDLPWNKQRDGELDDWRYSLAPQGTIRPPEFEQEYFPDTMQTYWIVRGYNRLPKNGGKLYELHGGATAEERLVPVVVFTKNAVTKVLKQPEEKGTADLIDEFEGLI